jgi:adenylate kinase
MRYRPLAGPAGLVVADERTAPPKLIIMGGPGCGKGTICKKIVETCHVVHISIGDILRQAAQEPTEYGKELKDIIASGRLVPDEIVIDILQRELMSPQCQEHGWLLDNFPRTPDQASCNAAFVLDRHPIANSVI